MIEYNPKPSFITLFFFMCFSLQEGDDEFSHSSLPEEANFTLDETLGGTFLTLDEIGVFLSCLVAGNGNFQ